MAMIYQPGIIRNHGLMTSQLWQVPDGNSCR